MSKRTFAELALIFDMFIWGLTFPFIRIVVSEISPIVLIFWRGIIASVILAFFVLRTKHLRILTIKLLPAGFILGIFFYISYLTQAIGLQTIESGRSAFISNLSIIFVPLLSPFFKRGLPNKNDMIASIIAFIGLLFLTDPFSQKGMRIGDFWTLMTALGFSIQIHLLQIYMQKFKAEGVFTFLQVFSIGIFASLSLPLVSYHGILNFFPSSNAGIYSLLFLACFATAFTVWLQARFQYETTPERAAVIYVMEPIFASIFGYGILHESMTLISLFGAFLMICAVLWGFIARLSFKA